MNNLIKRKDGNKGINELLNCPFCGGEAKYMEIKDFFISRFVTCTKCGIETPRNCLNRKDAIKRWNTRKPMANIVEKLEERRAKNDCQVCRHFQNGKDECMEDCTDALIDDLLDIVKKG